MSFSTGEQALAALAALGHKLDERGTEPVSLLICGGAAMNISGLLTRLTADVDVLGDMHANGELGEMPDWIHAIATEVAEELGLERHWLNDAAASVTSMGLPSGILLRATSGQKLRPFPLRDLCALVREKSAPCLRPLAREPETSHGDTKSTEAARTERRCIRGPSPPPSLR